MPRVVVDSDSMYPVYFVRAMRETEWPERAIDLTDDELADYKRVNAEFEEWQQRLADKLSAVGS